MERVQGLDVGDGAGVLHRLPVPAVDALVADVQVSRSATEKQDVGAVLLEIDVKDIAEARIVLGAASRLSDELQSVCKSVQSQDSIV